MSNQFSGMLGAEDDLERQLQSYLRGNESVGAIAQGLGYSDESVGAEEMAAVNAITALGFDPDTALGAVRAAKAVAQRNGVAPGVAINATLKKFVQQTVRREVASRGGGGMDTGGILARDLSDDEAFKYEGSTLVLSKSTAVGAGATVLFEMELDKPATIRELRFSHDGTDLLLTDFKTSGNFPFLALQFPLMLGHYGPLSLTSKKIKARKFPTKTTFRAYIQNTSAGSITPVLELWGTPSD